MYLNFLDKKIKIKIRGIARFYTVTSAMKFRTWETHASKTSVRDDPQGCLFVIFDIHVLPGAWKQDAPRATFYDPFLETFKKFRSPAVFEPNVWLWIAKQERSSSIV